MKIQMNLLAVFCLILPVFGGYNDDYLSSTDAEKAKIKELRGLIAVRVPHDYMKEDDWLLRWLREKDMDVPKAQEMILKTLRWREDNKIDNILKEDYAAFDATFHGYIEGCDMGGRPVMTVSVSDGDASKEIDAGNTDKLKRYTNKIWEEAVVMVRRMNSEGEKISQVSIILDLGGFSITQHACPKCIPIYLNILDSFQNNYPGYIHRVIAVNTPKYALPLWETYKSAASPKLRDTVKIYGEDKAKWEKYLREEISASECTAKYGGTRDKALDLHDLRMSKKAFKCSTPFSSY